MNFTQLAENRYQQQLRLSHHAGERLFREAAWRHFKKTGLPTPRWEDWRHTNLRAWVGHDWEDPLLAPDFVAPEALQNLMDDVQTRFHLIGLQVGQKLIKGTGLPQGCEWREVSPSIEDWSASRDGLGSLAQAAHQSGFTLEVAPDIQLSRPLVIIHWQAAGVRPWTSTFNRVLLGRGAEIRLIEIFAGEANDQGRSLRTQVTTATLAPSAQLTWTRLQEESPAATIFADVQVNLGRDARLHFTDVHQGASWVRANLQVGILGENAEAEINGLILGRDQDHIDQCVEVRHSVGESRSSQLFKTILRDRARAVVNGKIAIEKGAQKVQSRQLNQNLLLSPQAEIDSVPQLEILADDVKANHGASIGRLDPQQLFYLMSRGISKEAAGQMLAQAFSVEVWMRLPSGDLRDWLVQRWATRLPQWMQTPAVGSRS